MTREVEEGKIIISTLTAVLSQGDADIANGTCNENDWQVVSEEEKVAVITENWPTYK